MRRGRPVIQLSRRDVQLMIRKEIEKAMSHLEVKTILVGTKRKGRPIGVRSKKKKA